jgi:hypothetical protein
MQRPARPTVCTHLASIVLKREDVVRYLAAHTKSNAARSLVSRSAPLTISKSSRRSRPTIAERNASNWRPTLTHDPYFESQILLQGEPMALPCPVQTAGTFAFYLCLQLSAPLPAQSKYLPPGPQRGLRPRCRRPRRRGANPRPPSSYAFGAAPEIVWTRHFTYFDPVSPLCSTVAQVTPSRARERRGHHPEARARSGGCPGGMAHF